MKPSINLPFFILVLTLTVACGVKTQESESLKPSITVAAAANVQFAMDELIPLFEKENDVEVKLVTGSSGKLTSQIINGAPFHVFLSANMAFLQKLVEDGKVLGENKEYARGSLVLWSMLDSISLDNGVKSLLDPTIQKIGVAHPKNAPYGTSSIEAMKTLGDFEELEPKLVFGESVAQTNQYISLKSVDVGFTSKSVVLSKMKGKGTWVEVNPAIYEPIKQGAVLLSYAKDNDIEAAQRFYDFLWSEGAQKVLSKHGYRKLD